MGMLAQGIVDCVDPSLIRVTRIQGHVLDPSGVPIPTAVVSLSRDEKVIATTQTGEAGDFSIRVPAGEYEVRIKAKNFDQLHFRVLSGEDVSSVFRRSDIRAVLSIAHISCPWATTSNKEFQQELKISRKRYNADATPQ
jgi:Carboxypeptidase regulatory-like domain